MRCWKGVLEPLVVACWALLGPYWGRPGTVLELRWGRLGACGGVLGAYAAVLKRPWAPPGGDSEMYTFRKETEDFGASGGPERVLEGS